MFRNFCKRILLLCSKVFLKSCGIFLMVMFFGLFSLMMYSFYKDVFLHYTARGSYVFPLLEFLVLMMPCGNLMFNYLAAVFIKPGYTKDFAEELNTMRDEEELHEECGICHLPKPGNVHHCSACGNCIINFDHHCPWINNCVGFYNQRYFLLFVFYAWLSCVTFTAFILPIVLSGKYSIETIPTRFLLSSLLATVLGLSLFLFTLWTWYLAMSDQNVIDFIKYNEHTQRNIVWSKSYINNRLELIFGTKDYWKVIMPSLRKLTESPFSLTMENQGLMAGDNDW